MRPLRLAAASALAILGMARTALAQTSSTGGSNNYSVSWSQLQPGTDWAGQVINDLFPVFGAATTPDANETSVIGQMLGELNGFVIAIAMVWVAYSVIMRNHRGAETGKLLGTNESTMMIVRLGVAAVLLFPLPSGFCCAQAVVVKTSLWGVGMARVVYQNAIKALGPDGRVIATPMIPGTKTIVAGLMENELCSALINAASGTANTQTPLAPTPSVVSEAGNTISVAGQTKGGGVISYVYGLSPGNGDGSATCGSVTIRSPASGDTNIMGISVDMTQTQQNILNQIIGEIRPSAQTAAQNYFNDKKAADLAPLLTTMQRAVNDYTQDLTNAASNIRQQLQAKFDQAAQQPTTIDNFVQNQQNQYQLSSLGWTAAGAYYLEFARLNAQTMSLLSATPDIVAPTYSGLGDALSSDLAPLIKGTSSWLATVDSYTRSTDGADAPGGNAGLYTGVMPGSDGSGALDGVLRSLHLTDYFLQFVQYLLEPSSSYWQDPFGNLEATGNAMVLAALAALGTAGVLASKVGTAGAVTGSLLSFHWEAAIAAIAGHSLVSQFMTPIVLGCLALLLPGLTIAYVLPMVPFVMWIAGVAGWLILVCEGVIAAPLWMLAHMSTSGEGLHGRAHAGYALIFNIMFRPVLMLFGLFLGFFIFSSLSWLIHQTFGIAAGFVLNNGWFVTNLLGVIVLLSIFVTLHMVAAILSFRMISLVPHHVPQIIGFGSGGRVDLDQFARDAAIVGVGGVLNHIQRQAGESLEGRLDKGAKFGGSEGPRQIAADERNVKRLTDASSGPKDGEG